MEELSLVQKVVLVQDELKAPKGQFNKFGNYKYRSCEDIVESVKPILEHQVNTKNVDGFHWRKDVEMFL